MSDWIDFESESMPLYKFFELLERRQNRLPTLARQYEMMTGTQSRVGKCRDPYMMVGVILSCMDRKRVFH